MSKSRSRSGSSHSAGGGCAGGMEGRGLEAEPTQPRRGRAWGGFLGDGCWFGAGRDRVVDVESGEWGDNGRLQRCKAEMQFLEKNEGRGRSGVDGTQRLDKRRKRKGSGRGRRQGRPARGSLVQSAGKVHPGNRRSNPLEEDRTGQPAERLLVVLVVVCPALAVLRLLMTA